MKFSHRDFRPERRLKYVSQPPKRRPTLRILIFAAIGCIVYLKFDAFMASPFIRKLQASWISKASPLSAEVLNGKLPTDNSVEVKNSLPVPGVRGRWEWAQDSSRFEFTCGSKLVEACFQEDVGEYSKLLGPERLGPELLGQLRALISKCQSQWDVKPTVGFVARYSTVPTSEGRLAKAELQSLDFEDSQAHVSLRVVDHEGYVKYCWEGKCLDERFVHAPVSSAGSLEKISSPRPEWRYFLVAEESVHPALRGRIVSLPPKNDTSGEVKIYHGGELYTSYIGLTRLAAVHTGMMVNPKDTLGWTGPGKAGSDKVGAPALILRMENGGMAADPESILDPNRVNGLADAR